MNAVKVFKCQCESTVHEGTQPPPRCKGCPSCGTNIAYAPSCLTKPEPHFFMDARVGGVKRCRYCGKTEEELGLKVDHV